MRQGALPVYFAVLATTGLAHAFALGSIRHHTRRACFSLWRHHGRILRTHGDAVFLFSQAHPTADVAPLLKDSLKRDSRNEKTIIELMTSLEEKSKNTIMAVDDTTSDRFDPLLGLYEVSFVNTRKQNDNPVGGKWTRKNSLAQKLLRNRRSYQHLFTANTTGCGSPFRSITSPSGTSEVVDVVGEVVNIISLEALWGWIRTTVILRGDAVAVRADERTNATNLFYQPLSPLTVRAFFDAPRIVIGKTGRFFNVNIGPKTAVVLDTLYFDETVRIGLGGRSGTRFVFTRCLMDDTEALEFRALLSRKPWSKRKALLGLVSLAALGTYGGAAAVRGIGYRVVSFSVAVASLLLGTIIAFSGGGIESDDRSVGDSKRMLPKSN